MAVYNLAPLFRPQFVSSSEAPLTFAPKAANALAVVPANTNYAITELRVSNVTNAPVTLSVWLVQAGGTATPVNNVIFTINVPPATQTFPAFDVLPLWGEVLLPGDAIWMQAGSGSALTAWGSGVVATP